MRTDLRTALGLALCALVLLPSAAIASPEPFEGMRFSCPGVGDIVLTAPGNGTFTPGFIEGTDALLVPYVVDVTVSGADGSSVVAASKAAPVPDGAIVCSVDTTIHIGGVAYTFLGSVTGVVVGER
jgi:hypothetical protein